MEEVRNEGRINKERKDKEDEKKEPACKIYAFNLFKAEKRSVKKYKNERRKRN